MAGGEFPSFVRTLLEADLPLEGLRGWLLAGDSGQVLFLECGAEVDMPEHTHGSQWGIVVSGKVDLTVGGKTKTYICGESYTIAAGTPHKAHLHAGLRAIDFFTDPDRYKPKVRKKQGEP